jgi:hypothetical protein
MRDPVQTNLNECFNVRVGVDRAAEMAAITFKVAAASSEGGILE